MIFDIESVFPVLDTVAAVLLDVALLLVWCSRAKRLHKFDSGPHMAMNTIHIKTFETIKQSYMGWSAQAIYTFNKHSLLSACYCPRYAHNFIILYMQILFGE